MFSGVFVAQHNIAFLGRSHKPLAHAVASEISQDLQVDILDFSVLLKVGHQPSKRCRLKLSLGFCFHVQVLSCPSDIFSASLVLLHQYPRCFSLCHSESAQPHTHPWHGPCFFS